jgi:quinol monooxygenase YgiN
MMGEVWTEQSHLEIHCKYGSIRTTQKKLAPLSLLMLVYNIKMGELRKAQLSQVKSKASETRIC